MQLESWSRLSGENAIYTDLNHFDKVFKNGEAIFKGILQLVFDNWGHSTNLGEVQARLCREIEGDDPELLKLISQYDQ